MESFPVDLDAGQIVRWIMAEQAAKPAVFKTTARRTSEVEEIPARSELHLGDEEREELSEVATIATLEVVPALADEGWRLTITVEDEVGPRVSAEESVPETEQQIDLGTFYNTFIRPGRGTANVTADVVDPSGRANLDRLLAAIEHNRHAPGAGRPQSTGSSRTAG